MNEKCFVDVAQVVYLSIVVMLLFYMLGFLGKIQSLIAQSKCFIDKQMSIVINRTYLTIFVILAAPENDNSATLQNLKH